MSNIDKLTKLKELLDGGIITQEEFDNEKKQILSIENKKKNMPKNLGLCIAIFFVVVICISIISSTFSRTETASTDVEKKVTEQKVPDEFSGDCPVEVSGYIYDNIIGVPELSCSIKNNTDKEIAAVKLYFSPKDVYGEEVDGIFATKQLYTDNPISAGSSTKRSWQMIDGEIKSGDLYVYSVYFSDGTEWGNKDAVTSDVKKYGYKIQVSY